MDKIIGTLGITFIIILPLIRFYQRSNWTKIQSLIGIIGLTILWFFIATPLHELSHLIGAKTVGVSVTDYQLLPEYWKGDFRNAYINPHYKTTFQEIVVRLAPYLRDIVIVTIGYILLMDRKIKQFFVVGLILTFFLLNSVYDISTNFVGYSVAKDGDFNGLSKLIGHFWTYLISICILLVTLILSYRILKIYKGFPIIEIAD